MVVVVIESAENGVDFSFAWKEPVSREESSGIDQPPAMRRGGGGLVQNWDRTLSMTYPTLGRAANRTRQAIDAKKIEAREPMRLALDVLVQHLITVAIGGGFKTRAMLREVRSSHAFAELNALEWKWCLEFIQFGQ